MKIPNWETKITCNRRLHISTFAFPYPQTAHIPKLHISPNCTSDYFDQVTIAVVDFKGLSNICTVV